MNNAVNRCEVLGGLAVVVLLTLAILLPPLDQPADYHRFADVRTLWGIPYALNSLSNLGFLVLGLAGLGLAVRGRLACFSPALRSSAVVFFAGMVATAAGSTYYHLAPDDARLAVDRMCMTVVFAGVMGMAAAQRISEREGWFWLACMLIGGPAAVMYWRSAGSVVPYAVVQFGGIAVLALMLLAPARGPGPSWCWLLTAYAASKLLEMLDKQVMIVTCDLVSGHSLKHLVAALVALSVILPACRHGRVGAGSAFPSPREG